MRRSTFLATAAAGLLVAATATAEPPAIARPGLARIGASPGDASGVVFFLESDLSHGMVAVGTAHTLRLDDLARAGRVEFALPRSLAAVAHSERFAVAPGKPLDAEHASLRDDFVVFALASAPRGVRALEADARARLAAGSRVRVVGPGSGEDSDEEHVLGTVTSATPEHIEIDLDGSPALAGWGGSPVLAAESGRVVGLVEASVPGTAHPRVLAAPIGGVLDALSRPLDGGKGRAFAAFAAAAPESVPASAGAAPPQPAAGASAGERRALIDPTAGESTNLELAIEYPPDGAEVSSTVCGTFVAGHAQAIRGMPRRFDVILVIDTSGSTNNPAGTDVNHNGQVGTPVLGRVGSIFGAGLTDPGDSILAAEIAAARQVLRGLDPRSTRVGLVAFAGEAIGSGRSDRKAAYTVEGLTRDYARIESGLDELLAIAPRGETYMSAGVDQATIELSGLRGAYSETDPDSEKVTFFFTDGQPTLPYGSGAEAENVRAVLRAAERARREHIRIHSFALGPEALEGPIAAVEMASRTGGYFTPVRNPGDIVDVVEEVSFANLEKVTLAHVDTRAEAQPFRLTADGSWAGFLKLEPGRNRIRATAVAEGGATADRRIQVTHVEGADEAELPVELVVQRNRLLEDCLLLARQQRLDRERERNAEIRRALKLEIERERREARERAEAQRKSLDLEGEVDEELEGIDPSDAPR